MNELSASNYNTIITQVDDKINRIEDKFRDDIKQIDEKYSSRTHHLKNEVSGLTLQFAGFQGNINHSLDMLATGYQQINKVLEENVKKTNEIYDNLKMGKARTDTYTKIAKYALPVILFLQVFQLFITSHIPDDIEKELINVLK